MPAEPADEGGGRDPGGGTVAADVLAVLHAAGAGTVFGLPGVHNLALADGRRLNPYDADEIGGEAERTCPVDNSVGWRT